MGRAGRGGKAGRAVIQTYTPDNEVIQCAVRQDYDRFYEGEIRLRRLRRLPPFVDLFTLTVSGAEERLVFQAAIGVRDILRQRFGSKEVLGPAPAPVLKVNNRYRYRVLLMGKNDRETREKISGLLKAFAGNSANRGVNIFAECNDAE